MKRGEFSCTVCNITYGMEQVYKTGMYVFCSERCYSDYRKMSTEKQQELCKKHDERKPTHDQKVDRQLYQQQTL